MQSYLFIYLVFMFGMKKWAYVWGYIFGGRGLSVEISSVSSGTALFAGRRGEGLFAGGLIYEIQRYVLDDLIFAQNHL